MIPKTLDDYCTPSSWPRLHSSCTKLESLLIAGILCRSPHLIFVSPPCRTAKILGTAIDSCCTGSSVISLSQYKAYYRDHLVPTSTSINTYKSAGINFGSGVLTLLGLESINVPFTTFGQEFLIDFHVVEHADTPALMSINDLTKRNLDLRTLSRVVALGNREEALKFDERFEQMFHRWNRGTKVFYTLAELRKLHRALGHRSVEVFNKLLPLISRPCCILSMSKHTTVLADG